MFIRPSALTDKEKACERIAAGGLCRRQIEGVTMGQIDNGLLILLGIHAEDMKELNTLVEKIVHIGFEDENKK